MKKLRWMSLIAILLMFVLTSCGSENTSQNENTQAEVVADATDGTADMSETVLGEEAEDSQVSSTESEVNTEVESEEDSASQEILHFVDVFQQEYEVEINPNIEVKQYDNDLFVHGGEKLTYEDDYYYSRLGIDVSHHQGDIDWKQVKDFGVEFAILRIGYRGYGTTGSLNLDKKFKENIEAAQKEGIEVGVYFFAQAINDEEAKEEAEFVLSALEGYELQLPVVYDPESILDAEARTDNVTAEQFTRNTEIFCSTIREAGYEPMIYSNMLWEAYNLDLEQLADYPIWYADYELYPQTPYAFEYWQYTNEATVPGVSGATDLNIQLIEK